LAEIEKARKRILVQVPGIVRRVGTVSGTSFPKTVIRRIERVINQEGWGEFIIRTRFTKESQHAEGPRWRPLAASTIKQRLRKGYGAGPILVNTGRLMRDAVQKARRSITLGLRGVPRTDWTVSKLGIEYSKYVHRKRPFFRKPSRREWERVITRIRTLAEAEIRRMVRK
jgi:hypothetical protein